MSYTDCLAIVLRHEGGEAVSNHSADPGGLTKWGISQRAFPWLDIKALTADQAREIYREHYWRPIRGDDLPAPVALCVFDAAVNQGVGYATRLLQRALGVSPDGVLGPVTMAAAKGTPTVPLIQELMQLRADKYVDTVGFTTFGRGWMRRVVATTIAAMEMV